MTTLELQARARYLARNLERFAAGQLAQDLVPALGGECLIVGRALSGGDHLRPTSASMPSPNVPPLPLVEGKKGA